MRVASLLMTLLPALLTLLVLTFSAPSRAADETALSDLASAPSRFAEFEGGQLHYKDLGEGQPTIVLVHGWSCNLAMWRNVVNELANTHRVIALDLPGHGQSSAPRVEYTQDYLARGVAAILDQTHATPAVFVGHSMGYSVIRRYALAHPDKVLGLVNVDGAYLVPPVEPSALGTWSKEMLHFAEAFDGPTADTHTRDFIRSMFAPNETLECQDEVLNAMLSTPLHVRASAMLRFFDLDNWENEALPQPTVAIYNLTPERSPELEGELRALHPRLRFLTISNAGHFFLLCQPEAVLRAIGELLDEPR